MNYDDILALVRAGYSKSEIDAMGADSAAPAPKPAVQPTKTPEQPKPAVQQTKTPEQPKEPAAPEAPAPAPSVTVQPEAPTSHIDELLHQILGAVQANNRATITGDTAPDSATGIDAVREASARLMGITKKE